MSDVTFPGPAGIEIVEEPVLPGFRVRARSPATRETVEEVVLDVPLSWNPDAFDNLSVDKPSDLERREVEAVEEAHVPYSLGEGFLAGFKNCYMKGRTPRGDIEILFKGGGRHVEADLKISSQNVKATARDAAQTEELGGEGEDELLNALLSAKAAAITAAETVSSESEVEEEKENLDYVDDEEVEEVLDAGYVPEVLRRTDEIHVEDYPLKTITILSALSKPLVDMPLNLWSIGSSGAGKTHNFLTIFKTLPAERKVKFDACSPKALYYFTRRHGEDALANRVVLFNEVEASEDALQVLRSITDPSDEESVLASVEDQEFLEIKISGNPVTWFTSVDPVTDGQLEHRFLFSNPEESGEQKDKIAKHQRDGIQTGELQPVKETAFPVLKKAYREIIQETRDLDVIIPFNWEWKRRDNARLQTYFGALMHLLARINHRDRAVLNGHIVATVEDYLLAKLVWSKIEQHTLEKVKDADLDLLQELEDGDERKDLVEKTGKGYNTVKRALERLGDAGLVLPEKDGRVWKYKRSSKGGELPLLATSTERDENNQLVINEDALKKVFGENHGITVNKQESLLIATDPRENEGVGSEIRLDTLHCAKIGGWWQFLNPGSKLAISEIKPGDTVKLEAAINGNGKSGKEGRRREKTGRPGENGTETNPDVRETFDRIEEERKALEKICFKNDEGEPVCRDCGSFTAKDIDAMRHHYKNKHAADPLDLLKHLEERYPEELEAPQ